ncbi:MAG: Nif3-like dinuclear metal center hexameric protein [Kiritimatiellae bacterium]|nr:Nif3-like dinuclear metal center hexameric protein [Kiritimatiellia bacterium]
MKLDAIVSWLDKTLDVASFDDVSNNGIQIERNEGPVKMVAFAVDASVKTVEAAIEAGAELLVVHHGISWGGGIKKIAGGVRQVMMAATKGNLALYAAHLPLDANRKVGNNWELARHIGLRKGFPAFSYHGNTIGVVGYLPRGRVVKIGGGEYEFPAGRIGICSGGAGEFAEEAKALGCKAYLTGEANWGEKVAAENAGTNMICAGHYDTEVFGVKALSRLMAAELPVKTLFIDASAGKPEAKKGTESAS